MNSFTPDVAFRLFNSTFRVDCVNGDKVRFHRDSDVFEVWELSSKWLTEKQRDGKLEVVDD